VLTIPILLCVSIQANAATVEVRTIRGAGARGELRAIGAENIQVDSADGKPTTIARRDCLAIQFMRPESKPNDTPNAPAEAIAELTSGDWIHAPILGGSGDKIEFQLGGSTLAVDVDAVRKLVFPARVPRGFVEQPPPANGDRLYKKNPGAGESEGVIEPVNGTLIAFHKQGIEFEGNFGKDIFAYDRIVSLLVSQIGSKNTNKTGAVPDAVIALAPEGKLAVKLGELRRGSLECESPVLGSLTLPLRAVRAIRLRNERFRDLSELEPAEVAESPYFGGDGAPRFPWRRDRSVTGGSLRVAGVLYETGLGVHSKCSLSYAVPAGFLTFRAKAGIDDSTMELPRKGSVVFRVLGDGSKLWESGILRTGDRAETTPEIDLRGVKKLTLEADFADGFDIADRADWCEPILLREPAEPAPASGPSRK
jgi:hypothetical protein